MKITVLGAGAWGTALAQILCEPPNQVTLWGRNPDHLREIERLRCNERYLSGVPLAPALGFNPDLASSVTSAEIVVMAVPSHAFRHIALSLAGYPGLVISVTKGIESATGLTMAGILGQTIPGAKVAALSGPTLAYEVARGIPTAAVVASADTASATTIQSLLHRPAFRVYTSNDLLGVEFGGALKNVIAIAAGVCDGLGFGDNSKAALVTRGLAEMQRLGVAAGAQPHTLYGLSGAGDLMVTCFSKLSRNRQFGERLGRGETADAILQTTRTVAEGFPTCQSAYQLARRLNVETPIIDEIYAALYEAKPPAKVLRELMGRELKQE